MNQVIYYHQAYTMPQYMREQSVRSLTAKTTAAICSHFRLQNNPMIRLVIVVYFDETPVSV